VNIDGLLNRLERVGALENGRWKACCPAHGDRSPSLAVRELDDGRILLHCFAGCKVEDVVQALQLDLSDLFPDRLTSHSYPPQRKPFTLGQVAEALEFELTVALVVLADVSSGKDLTAETRSRAALAQRRIGKYIGELQRAK
jgi:hypothetical protein